MYTFEITNTKRHITEAHAKNPFTSRFTSRGSAKRRRAPRKSRVERATYTTEPARVRQDEDKGGARASAACAARIVSRNELGPPYMRIHMHRCVYMQDNAIIAAAAWDRPHRKTSRWFVAAATEESHLSAVFFFYGSGCFFFFERAMRDIFVKVERSWFFVIGRLAENICVFSRVFFEIQLSKDFGSLNLMMESGNRAGNNRRLRPK